MGKEQAVLDHVMATAPKDDPDATIAAVDQFCSDGNPMMNLGAEKGRIVDVAIDNVAAQNVLELGSFFGYSATRMANRIGANGSLITIEADPERHAVSRRMVEYAGLSNRVQLLHGKAEDVIPGLQGQFDLVLIDHYGKNYLPDLKLIETHGLLRAGSAVVADNVVAHRPTVDSYLEHVRSSGCYRSTLNKVGGDGVEVSIWLAV
jgi:catechol O-methyltransferase